MEGGRAGVSKACNHCRQAHVACEESYACIFPPTSFVLRFHGFVFLSTISRCRERPCRRCVRLGLGDHCTAPPARKRGRPSWKPKTEAETNLSISKRSQ